MNIDQPRFNFLSLDSTALRLFRLLTPEPNSGCEWVIDPMESRQEFWNPILANSARERGTLTWESPANTKTGRAGRPHFQSDTDSRGKVEQVRCPWASPLSCRHYAPNGVTLYARARSLMLLRRAAHSFATSLPYFPLATTWLILRPSSTTRST